MNENALIRKYSPSIVGVPRRTKPAVDVRLEQARVVFPDRRDFRVCPPSILNLHTDERDTCVYGQSVTFDGRFVVRSFGRLVVRGGGWGGVWVGRWVWVGGWVGGWVGR